MAEATINETLLSYIYRRNQINMQITQYQNRKTLATTETADLAEWKTARYRSARTEYKKIWQTSHGGADGDYTDYTLLPEYQQEVEYINAKYDAEIAEITAWETNIDNQITTLSTELTEINAYTDTFKSMLSENIKNDYNYAEGL